MDIEQIEKLKNIALEVRVSEDNFTFYVLLEHNGFSSFLREYEDEYLLSHMKTEYLMLTTKPFDLIEQVKIPLTVEDLIQRVKEGKTMWIQNKFANYCDHINSVDPEGITIGKGFAYSYHDLMEWSFMNDDPCYKLESRE